MARKTPIGVYRRSWEDSRDNAKAYAGFFPFAALSAVALWWATRQDRALLMLAIVCGIGRCRDVGAHRSSERRKSPSVIIIVTR